MHLYPKLVAARQQRHSLEILRLWRLPVAAMHLTSQIFGFLRGPSLGGEVCGGGLNADFASRNWDTARHDLVGSIKDREPCARNSGQPLKPISLPHETRVGLHEELECKAPGHCPRPGLEQKSGSTSDSRLQQPFAPA